MTHKEWTLMSLGSQQHLPGVFSRLAATNHSARRFRMRQEEPVNTVAPALAAAAAAGLQAGPNVKSHACVACEPAR